MGLARYEKHKVNGIVVNGVLMGLMGVNYMWAGFRKKMPSDF